jgi:hypothetical protein
MSQLPLPAGRRQFIDENGAPLVGGTVQYCYPGGLTPKDTYQDFNGSELNDNPLTLDELGSAAIWGTGRYREIVRREDGTLVWDQETALAADALSYDLKSFFYEGSDPPETGQLIMGWSVSLPTNYDSGMAASTFKCLVNPTAQAVLNIYNNTDLVATLTVETDGSYDYSTGGTGAWQTTYGDYVTVKMGTADASLNELFGTLVGSPA